MMNMYTKTIEVTMPKDLAIHFHEIKPENTMIISDLTGTLIHQREDGFPEKQKEVLRKLLKHNFGLTVVTGDSLPAVEKYFIKPLNAQEKIYVVSGAGHQVGEYANLSYRSWYQEKDKLFTLEDRNAFLERLLYTINKAYKLEITINAPELAELQTVAGGRIDLNLTHEKIGESLLIEVRPNVLAVVFSNSEVKAEHKTALFERIMNDKEIKLLLEKQKEAELVSGNNFVNIITSNKYTGLKNFYTCLKDNQELNVRNNIIIMGDSSNDLGLYKYEYPKNYNIYQYFLGGDDKVYFAAKNPKNNIEHSLYLKDSYTEGSYSILSALSSLISK